LKLVRDQIDSVSDFHAFIAGDGLIYPSAGRW
jgi:hypothetical protein